MDKIEKNFTEYINLLSAINRDGIGDLINFITSSDFKVAPASTSFHSNIKGGLCQHSLDVYTVMSKLVKEFCPDIPEDTVKIVSLLHDVSKVNFYKETSQNKKIYSNYGSKRDELGNFDWVATLGYKVKDATERDLIIGDHGVNSFYIINKYITLSDGEAAAIINHHAGMDNNYILKDLNEAMNRYPTLTLLHTADLLSTYIYENIYLVEDE